jgi:hypothetical protein
LEPWAKQITEERSGDETLVDKLLNKMQTDQWDTQFKGLLIKIIGAQVKYIKLLERRIEK